MDEDFEQNYYSKTAYGIYKIGHDSIRFMKSMVYYDKGYENNFYFDLMSSVLSTFK